MPNKIFKLKTKKKIIIYKYKYTFGLAVVGGYHRCVLSA